MCPLPPVFLTSRLAGIVDFSGNNITGPIVSELGLLTATSKMNDVCHDSLLFEFSAHVLPFLSS